MTKEMINDLMNEIKNDVFDFYGVEVEDETVENFIDFYYLNLEEDCYKPFDDEGIPLFDTSEREDFMYYLEDLGIIELND
jgi:hypothetical protein